MLTRSHTVALLAEDTVGGTPAAPVVHASSRPGCLLLPQNIQTYMTTVEIGDVDLVIYGKVKIEDNNHDDENDEDLAEGIQHSLIFSGKQKEKISETDPVTCPPVVPLPPSVAVPGPVFTNPVSKLAQPSSGPGPAPPTTKKLDPGEKSKQLPSQNTFDLNAAVAQALNNLARQQSVQFGPQYSQAPSFNNDYQQQPFVPQSALTNIRPTYHSGTTMLDLGFPSQYPRAAQALYEHQLESNHRHTSAFTPFNFGIPTGMPASISTASICNRMLAGQAEIHASGLSTRSIGQSRVNHPFGTHKLDNVASGNADLNVVKYTRKLHGGDTIVCYTSMGSLAVTSPPQLLHQVLETADLYYYINVAIGPPENWSLWIWHEEKWVNVSEVGFENMSLIHPSDDSRALNWSDKGQPSWNRITK
ncbi:hypothetical protein DXG01_001960 [Tephrocybe rancida]|nr:hypothetical protein DXG01_001960 [Tephrocybe rancida]